MKVAFFSLFSSPPVFLSCLVTHTNNSKTPVNLTRFATEQHTLLQLALNLQYERKSNKTHQLKRIFLHREKDQTKNVSPFRCKRPLITERILTSSQFHFKGLHFKSTSSGSFVKVRWKSGNHTETRNPSETYLGPSQRSMMEPFRFNN